METDEQAYCVACNTPLGNAADPIPCPKCGNEDIRRVSNEREQVAEVFGLTGGELEETAWVPMFDVAKVTNTLTRCEPFTFTYWYQGIPGYAAENFETAPTYRTVCNQELYGTAPDVVTDDEGTWIVVARYRSSGETECPYRAPSYPFPKADNAPTGVCPLCEADLMAGEPHGYIYIGDGWAEIVYRLFSDD